MRYIEVTATKTNGFDKLKGKENRFKINLTNSGNIDAIYGEIIKGLKYTYPDVGIDEENLNIKVEFGTYLPL